MIQFYYRIAKVDTIRQFGYDNRWYREKNWWKKYMYRSFIRIVNLMIIIVNIIFPVYVRYLNNKFFNKNIQLWSSNHWNLVMGYRYWNIGNIDISGKSSLKSKAAHLFQYKLQWEIIIPFIWTFRNSSPLILQLLREFVRKNYNFRLKIWNIDNSILSRCHWWDRNASLWKIEVASRDA